MKINGKSHDQNTAPRLQASPTGKKLLALGLILSSSATLSLTAETYERIQPKLPGDDGLLNANPAEVGTITSDESDPRLKEINEARLNTVLIEQVNALVFVTSASEVKSSGVSGLTGVNAAESLSALASVEFDETIASKYLWEPLTLRKLNALNRDTVAFLRANGSPVVDVIIPEQDITSGCVQLIVLKGKVGEINITGNEHFSTELLASQIGSQSGGEVTGDAIREDLNWINRNPFRSVNLLYSRGDDFSETDLNFQVEDRRPVRFYGGYENSGVKATDRNRYLVGVNAGNLWGLDHQANYQFSFAPDVDDFYAHSGSYIIPLKWRHILSFYGAYSNSTAEIDSGILDADGESYTLGIRYAIPLKSTDNFNHEVFGGYEYKYSENTLTFNGVDLPETKTEVSHFNLGYSAGLRDKWGSTQMTLTGFYSPGDMFSHNDDDAFETARFKGEAEYTYGRLSLERLTRLPRDFSLLTSITGQYSDDNLIGSELLGAGGYATVRGYNERVANAESGIITTLELRSPQFSVTGHENNPIARALPGDQVQLLTFWDYAQLDVSDTDELTDFPESYSLSSAGAGIRYTMTESFSLRFDYGWQLKDSAVGNSGDSRGHVGVIFSY